VNVLPAPGVETTVDSATVFVDDRVAGGEPQPGTVGLVVK